MVPQSGHFLVWENVGLKLANNYPTLSQPISSSWDVTKSGMFLLLFYAVEMKQKTIFLLFVKCHIYIYIFFFI